MEAIVAAVIGGLVAGGFVAVGVEMQFRRQSKAALRALMVEVASNKEAAADMTQNRQPATPFVPGRPDPGWLKHSIWDSQLPYVVRLFDENTLILVRHAYSLLDVLPTMISALSPQESRYAYSGWMDEHLKNVWIAFSDADEALKNLRKRSTLKSLWERAKALEQELISFLLKHRKSARRRKRGRTVEDPTLSQLFEQARAAQTQPSTSKPAPDRHPNRDFFVADILDWALKDDHTSTEHPFFSLSETPDHRVRHYERNGLEITVKPSADGMATIWDKDVLIFSVSQLIEAINQGRPVTHAVRLETYDLLVTTNRDTSGKNYERLADAFRRLAGIRIETNIATNGRCIREEFGLIDNWRVVERSPDNSQMVAVELVFNEWLYNAILGREVLTLNHDYFRLDGSLERRLHELARKHCGDQQQWTVSLSLLHTKSGSTAPLKKFRQHIKNAAGRNVLPDYALSYQTDTDQVTFVSKNVGPSGTGN